MTLQIEYRPTDFDQFYGNSQAIAALSAKLSRDSCPHTFLITGPSGCGKTTVARIIATVLGALEEGEDAENSLDYRELNTADFRGIDTARSIISSMRLSTVSKKCKVYFMDECHQISKDAQEALLKALEDTPDHVYFIFATTDPQKLKNTFRRRCSKVVLTAVQKQELIDLMQGIIEAEEKSIPEEVLEDIVDVAEGSPGIALGLLDDVIDLSEDEMLDEIQKRKETTTAAIDLCRALIKKSKWGTISKILREIKETEKPEDVRRAVMGYCTSIIIKGDNPRAYIVLDSFREPFYDNGFPDLVLACYEAIPHK